VDGKKDMTFYDVLREEFLREMGIKTGWGRVEVIAAFDRAFARAVVRYAALKGIEIG
jgi:hypothetical protein